MRTLKNLWHQICRDKLFTAIYIFGTALTLATVTVIAVMMWNKVAPVYPEYQRDNTVYVNSLKTIEKTDNGNMTRQGYLGLSTIKDFIFTLPHHDIATAYIDDWDNHYAQRPDGGRDIELRRKPADPAFFQLFNFKFLAGKPWGQAEFDSGLRVAVLGDRTARKIFGATEPEQLIGRRFTLDFVEYTVCGIVKEGTPTETVSYAGVIIPYTSLSGFNNETLELWGSYCVALRTDDKDGIRRALKEKQERYNSSHDDIEISFFDQPVDSVVLGIAGNTSIEGFNLTDILLAGTASLLVLLLVPALNLSGIIWGRMEGRLPEMGVRKAFGANRSTLLSMVLWENLCLTIAGGIIGFAAAFLMLKFGITDLFVTGNRADESIVTNEMVLSGQIIIFIFLVCCLLNIMSALVPAWRSLRKPIVESLKEN